MIPKATEDTITALIAEELKKHGVKVQLFPSINTPKGIRKPDAVCINAGQYVMEAKFHERDLLQAVAKVQNDYLKFYKILGIKGGFALLYPRELAKPMSIGQVRREAYRRKFRLITMFPPEDKRNFAVIEGHIGEIAKVIAEHVLTPPSYVEPSVPYIIETLRQSAQYIVNGLRHLSSQQLEEFFGGKHVFQNILQYEEQKYPLEDLRLAAAYILVNQLLFYHVLSAKRPDIFPQIEPDELRSPIELGRYFNRVLGINYKPVFQYDACKLIPRGYLDHVKMIINAIKGLSPEKVGGDLLGTIFHDLVPFEVRKSVAAFYTNVLAAELLAWLSINDPSAKVADFACGSGGLLVAAYRRKKYLTEQLRGKFTYEDHKRFLEKELLGIDVMPFAASVAACHLSLQSPEYFTDRVQIGIWDSTELKPGDVIPTIAGVRYVLRGQVGLEAFEEEQPKIKGVVRLSEAGEEKITLDKYDVVIMNPPFTRQERIPEEYKALLEDRFSEYEEQLHGQLGYYGYFILLADRFLKDGGRLALVLPATVLRVRSCEGIRKMLAEKYSIEHIITTQQRSAFSESVKFREILLVARKIKPVDNTRVIITVLKRLPGTIREAREIADEIKNSQTDWEDDKVVVKIREYSELTTDTSNWFKFIAVSDPALIDLMKELLRSDRLVPLSTIAEAQRIDLEHLKFKNFHGFIIYDKMRAQKKIDKWILRKVDEKGIIAEHIDLGFKVRIPQASLGRGLRRTSYVKIIDITKTSDYLILSWFDKIREMARTLLTKHELRSFNKSILNRWKMKFEARKSNLLIARRFDLSAPGTSLLAFYSETPIVGVDMWCVKGLSRDDAKIIALWFNSTLNLLQVLITRTETRGAWMKIHDYMFNELLAPDPRKLNNKEREDLLNVFEETRDVEFPSIVEQLEKRHKARKLVDKAWLRILGYKGNVDVTINRLYKSLAKEIKLLKELMKEKDVF